MTDAAPRPTVSSSRFWHVSCFHTSICGKAVSMPQASNVLSFPVRSQSSSKTLSAPQSDSAMEIRAYLKDIIDIAYEGLLTNSARASPSNA